MHLKSLEMIGRIPYSLAFISRTQVFALIGWIPLAFIGRIKMGSSSILLPRHEFVSIISMIERRQ